MKVSGLETQAIRFGESFKIVHRQIDSCGNVLDPQLQEYEATNDIPEEQSGVSKPWREKTLINFLNWAFQDKNADFIHLQYAPEGEFLVIDGKDTAQQELTQWHSIYENSRWYQAYRSKPENCVLDTREKFQDFFAAEDEFHQQVRDAGIVDINKPELVLRYDPVEDQFPFIKEDLAPVFNCLA